MTAMRWVCCAFATRDCQKKKDRMDTTSLRGVSFEGMIERLPLVERGVTHRHMDQRAQERRKCTTEVGFREACVCTWTLLAASHRVRNGPVFKDHDNELILAELCWYRIRMFILFLMQLHSLLAVRRRNNSMTTVIIVTVVLLLYFTYNSCRCVPLSPMHFDDKTGVVALAYIDRPRRSRGYLTGRVSVEMKWLIPAVSQSQRFGMDTLHTAATLSSQTRVGCVHCPTPFSFGSTSPQSIDTSPAGPVPSWVLSQTRPPISSRQRPRSAATTTNMAVGLGNAAVAFATTVTNNGMLLVRGGGGGGIPASSPLCGVLLATACLSAVLERCTKAGAVVGAPLLSFGTFCILRFVV